MTFLRGSWDKSAGSPWDEFDEPRVKAPCRRWRWRLSLLEVVTIASILAVLVGLMLPGGDYDVTHRFPPPSPASKDSFADVAGDYYHGDGLGSNNSLNILSDGRYSFILSGCCGVYERESGYVKRIRDHLILSPIKQAKSRMDRVFLPLHWGAKTYLIPPEKFQKFCDRIVSGDEPRNVVHGHYYLNNVEERVSGVPELPEQWASYVRDHALIGTITEVAETGRARIDVGSADGLRVGSRLIVQGRNRWKRELDVVSVNENTCEAVDDMPSDSQAPLEAGWTVVVERAKVCSNP